MAIDVNSETLISLTEACRVVPPRGISPATIARWIQRGVRGAKLETCLCGGRRFTSREALQRFFAAQNAPGNSAVQITATQRRNQAEAADRLLREAGI